MAYFFIKRPIFAWVIALLICLGGVLTLPMIPISQYPIVAPPSISITTSYPGASTSDLYYSVTRLIEEELSGAPGLLNFESTSDTTGEVEIFVDYKPGTDIALAAVDAQNRIKRIEQRLPPEVQKQGIAILEASTAILQFVTLTSSDGSLDEISLGDVATRFVLQELRKISGVGRVRLFSTERSMRVWLDPDKMRGFSLTVDDVTSAIRSQNALVSSGMLAQAPSSITERTQNMVLVKGQLETPDEFGAIVLRANQNGSTVRLRDVSRIEIGGQVYAYTTRLNGKPAAAIAIQLAPSGNALATGDAVRRRMNELQKFFPPGVKSEVSYDVTPVIRASVKKVILTLIEAVALVFVVMFLFLQNFRYTLIPTIVVPIALLGTCCALYLLGLSINVLSMFGMVLAIGILVDDAIVVVENVERLMVDEGLSPRDATIKAMSQITGAVIGITMVLIAVFVPMGFFPGSVGIMYQQFSSAMAISIAFSAFLALSLTPALCATLLKPVTTDHHVKKGFFGYFNRFFERVTCRYEIITKGLLGNRSAAFVAYVVLLAALGFGFLYLPSSFVPIDDQGYLMADVLLPSDASTARTVDVVSNVESEIRKEAAVNSTTFITGYSFFGQGAMTAQAFIALKDWSRRSADTSADSILKRVNGNIKNIPDAEASLLAPPPIANLGNTSGFSFRLQDRGQRGYEALIAAKTTLLKEAATSKVLGKVTEEGLPAAPIIKLDIDREKAGTLGVSFRDINDVISTNVGSVYVNDFINRGRTQRVIVQADEADRVRPDDILRYSVRNKGGDMTPLAAFAKVNWALGPTQIVGFNGYPSIRLTGEPKQGFTSGDAITEMERLMSHLPQGFGYEWTGQSLQEKLAGSQATFLLGLSMLLVFLSLAALYESWAIPFSVMLAAPLGLIGCVAAAYIAGLSNDVFFTIGLITIIGLSAKNAILIIEFAQELRAQGAPLFQATMEAARLRFRPIVMTSLAFILGVIPLMIASGASAKSQQVLGIGVFGGMVSATVLTVFFVPVFFIAIITMVRTLDNECPTAKCWLSAA